MILKFEQHRLSRRLLWVLIIMIIPIWLSSCAYHQGVKHALIRHFLPSPTPTVIPALPELPQPLGLPDPNAEVPPGNPSTAKKVALGKDLFFDKELSKAGANGQKPCVSCHLPNEGFTDGKESSEGANGFTPRNSPTILNRVFGDTQFRDGRAKEDPIGAKNSMEVQATMPLDSHLEMGHDNVADAVTHIKNLGTYNARFQDIFGSGVTQENIGKAIAAYERTLLSGNSKWDQFVARKNVKFSSSAIKGVSLFRGKAQCVLCHDMENPKATNLTDEDFHSIGVGWNVKKDDYDDYGRGAPIKDGGTGLPADRGKFKTPTLRDIARTGPYMHDGSFDTLEEIVAFYNKGGDQGAWDIEIKPLGLSRREQGYIVEFLKTLNGEKALQGL